MELSEVIHRSGQEALDMERRALGASLKQTAPRIVGGGESGSGDRLGSSAFGAREGSEHYRHFSGWPYTAISRIAERISSQPAHVAKKVPQKRNREGLWIEKERMPCWTRTHSDLKVLDSHKLLDLIDDPNEFMVRAVLLRVTVYNFLITGKSYWWMFRSGGRDTIWPIPTTWVQPVHDDEALFSKWRISPGGSNEGHIVDGDEIAYFYNPDPSNPFDAISPMGMLKLGIRADEMIQEAQVRAFQNGIHPGALIIAGRHPGAAPGAPRRVLEPHQRLQMISSLKQHYGNVTRHGEPLILDGLIEDVKPWTRTPAEMDFLSSGKQSKSRIMQGFGVNPLISGEIQAGNRAQAVEAEANFCNSALNPLIELFSQVITAWVAPRFARPGEKLVFWLEPCFAKDRELRLKELDLLTREKAIGRHELREQLRLPGDFPPDDDIILNPQQVVEPINTRSITGDTARLFAAAAGRLVNDKKSSDRKAAVISLFIKQLGEAQEDLQEVAEKLFRDQFFDVISRFNALPIEAIRVDQLFRAVDWIEPLLSRIREPLLRTMVRGAVAEMATLQRRVLPAGWPAELDDLALGLPQSVVESINTELAEVLEQEYWSGVSESVAADLESQISSSLAAGESKTQLADRIRGVLGADASKVRATRIARTESTGALNAGHHSVIEGLAAEGAIDHKEWLPIIDDRVRDDHVSMSGAVVKVGELFSVGGEQAPYPGHFGLSAAQRIHCRCVLLSAFPEERSLHASSRRFLLAPVSNNGG